MLDRPTPPARRSLRSLVTLARLLVLGVGALLIGFGLVSSAQAHSLLLRSIPAADADLSQPPGFIELWFTEALETNFSTARLVDTTGADVETGALVFDSADRTHLTLPLGQLQPGIYTVVWQTLSQVDGHEWYGSFPFTVLNADGSRPSGTAAGGQTNGRGELPTPAETFFRWLALLGAALLWGAPLFRLLAGAEVARANRTRPAAEPALAARVSLLARGAVWAAVALLLAGSLGQVVVQSLRLGALSNLPQVLLDTRVGVLALARVLPALAALWISLQPPLPAAWLPRARLGRWLTVAGAVLMGALFAWAAVQGGYWVTLAWVLVLCTLGWELNARGRLWPALLVLALGALAGYSASSHAAAVDGRGWAVLSDYVHLLAAGSWFGGLALLPWMLWRERATSDPTARAAAWKLARRYSFLASFSIFILTLTGLVNSLVQIPDLPSLWGTAYGRVLLLKLGVLGLTLPIALLNNRLLHRRQAAAEAVSLRTLRRQALVEGGVALGLMLTVAVLVQSSTPRFTVPATAYLPQLPFTTTLVADDLNVHAQITPNAVGDNKFWLHLYHAAGDSVGEVQLVELRFNFLGAQLGQTSVDLAPLGQATFEATGAYLSQAGPWAVSVYVRRRGLDDTLTTFNLTVPAPANPTGGTLANVFDNPVPAIPGLVVAALVLFGLGLAPLVWRRPLAAFGPRLASSVTVAGFVLLVVALGFSVAGAPAWRDQILAQQAATRTNPIPASAESLAAGQALFEQNCAPCHGPQGLGDGPVGVTLRPAPANLQVHMVPGVHTDAQIFDWITNGFPNSQMPAFGEVLTEDARWNIMNYIRTLVPPDTQPTATP